MRKIITLILFLPVFLGFAQTKEIDSLSIALAFQTSDTLKVDTSLKLIEYLFENKDYDRAIKYIIESDKLSSKIGYRDGIAKTTYYKALIYARKSDYINAIDGYTKAKALFNQLKDTLNVAKVNNSIGLIEIERGNYSKGLQYSLSAIKELENRNLYEELRTAYASLGRAYSEINDMNKAIEFNTKALEIQEQLNDNEGISNSSLKLAELYSKIKEHRKAIDFYERVLAGKNGKNDSLRSEILPKLGGEYLNFNDYDTATKYLIQGLNLNRKNRNQQNLMVTLHNLGSLNLSQNRLIIAEQQLLEAGAIARRLNDKEELLKHYKLMKALDSTKRKFDGAFVWQRNYYNLKDSLEKAKTKPISETVKIPEEDLNLNFDQEEAKIEADLENKEQIITESQDKLTQFKLFFYILLGALALVCIFLVWVYMKRNNSLKYAQELEEKNLKIQLQNEAFVEQTKHLENINNVKDKLFSIVSHDLKDSLSSINGFIDLLRDGSLSREEFDNLIPELSENANNASLLLFNLLNWSKSQMQSLKPSPSLFDIQEVFEEKVKLVEQRLESKGIELVDHSLRDFAYADRSMIEIVIQNLLANALKFSRKGDKITISNHISNGTCILSIADTGVGISQHNIEKLFKSSSFTTMGTNNEKGTGLGLSICRELVELNGGKIWVESTVNVGSTFYVQLPKSKPNGDH
ncbi:tetratricopeptide repeat-containing sensor histidine kinase [Hyunsoonleella sp. SJ7]|uniref:histidine kinase n=1 Tax=Hyunsoonleella aquatilis TaxID=2762758 RepID=A0A923H8R9_9FLAO|nr:ATP-binding protein [Hyunsoonleella aquatilis]MBC3759316.1 tetratricopeptide repeat-containing sensor histidine kinase [Hyunsoonleella aquatilis]